MPDEKAAEGRIAGILSKIRRDKSDDSPQTMNLSAKEVNINVQGGPNHQTHPYIVEDERRVRDDKQRLHDEERRTRDEIRRDETEDGRRVRESNEAVERDRRIKTRSYIAPREQTSEENRKTKIQLTLPDLLLFLIIIAIQYWDFNSDFGRTPQLLASFFTMYTIIAILCTAFLKLEGEEFWPAFIKHYWPAALIATLWPRLFGFGFSLVPQGFGGTIVGTFSFIDIVKIIVTLLPIFAFMVYRNSKSFFVPFIKFWYMFWIMITLIFIVAGQIQNIPGGTGVTFQGSDGVQTYFDFIWENFRVAASNLAGVPSVVHGSINSTINRYTEPYFTGTVEKSKTDSQLGVYLDNIDPSQDTIYPEDDTVVVYADVKAKSFTGEIILKTNCYAIFRPEDPAVKTFTMVEGQVDIPELNIHDFEQNQLTCTIDRQLIKTKDPSIKIEFRSSFNFITWGYMDMAFMERQELARRKETINAQLGIPKNVQAISTRGPIELGLANQNNPPMQPTGLDLNNNPPPPLFGVTMKSATEYAKRGHLTKIKKLIFHVPKYMFLKDGSCNPVTPSVPESTEDGNFNLYTFTDVPVHKEQTDETIRCRLDINPGDIQAFLGTTGGIALTTFSVEAEYEYELTNSAYVKIAPPEAIA